MSDDAEPGAALGAAPENLNEVQRRLAEIQSRKRGRIRWAIGRHTAELAIGALDVDRKIASTKNGKQRRRKRNKRLL
ncbi:MAG TPA: hypothetical protein VH277_03040 [Gemmatimonadaceae bacterium]|jgi:hypothetical protein|nr:hypothetical protein [Gemmatimonadaceae bacterium]